MLKFQVRDKSGDEFCRVIQEKSSPTTQLPTQPKKLALLPTQPKKLASPPIQLKKLVAIRLKPGNFLQLKKPTSQTLHKIVVHPNQPKTVVALPAQLQKITSQTHSKNFVHPTQPKNVVTIPTEPPKNVVTLPTQFKQLTPQSQIKIVFQQPIKVALPTHNQELALPTSTKKLASIPTHFGKLATKSPSNNFVQQTQANRLTLPTHTQKLALPTQPKTVVASPTKPKNLSLPIQPKTVVASPTKPKNLCLPIQPKTVVALPTQPKTVLPIQSIKLPIRDCHVKLVRLKNIQKYFNKQFISSQGQQEKDQVFL